MHFAGIIVYNNRPMRADFYLTLYRGLLAVALYHPRKPHAPVRVPGGWSMPAASVLRDTTCTGQTTLTSVSPAVSYGGLPVIGLESSATPICGYRLSLHA